MRRIASGGGGEEWPATVSVPARVVPDEPDVRIVDERRGLGSFLARLFPGESSGGQIAELVGRRRQGGGRGLWVAGRGRVDQTCDLGHAFKFTRRIAAYNLKAAIARHLTGCIRFTGQLRCMGRPARLSCCPGAEDRFKIGKRAECRTSDIPDGVLALLPEILHDAGHTGLGPQTFFS